MECVSSEIDCDVSVKYPSVVDRYFKRKYKTDVNGIKRCDQCVLLHSNKICVVTVAPSHPILAEKKTVVKVDFQVGKNTNRLDNKVSGKGKKGAQSLSRTAPLCHVTCSDGEVHTLHSCVKGSLVEVNENLVENPQLLSLKPETDGYLAIVLICLKDYEKETEKLKSREEYQKFLQDRCLPVN